MKINQVSVMTEDSPYPVPEDCFLEDSNFARLAVNPSVMDAEVSCDKVRKPERHFPRPGRHRADWNNLKASLQHPKNMKSTYAAAIGIQRSKKT
jgi:hypothetical protein